MSVKKGLIFLTTVVGIQSIYAQENDRFLNRSYDDTAISSSPKRALIVGASTGIGKELAKVLAQHGYELGLCSRKIDLLEELAQELPTKVSVKQIDLMDIDNVQRLLGELVVQMGGVDLIVVNSGIWPEHQDGLLPANHQVTFQWIQDTIKVNILGCAAAFNFATNYFLNQNSGHIVGISSLDAVHGTAIGPAYSGSKSFMATFLEGLRTKFAQLKIPIDVTEIRPGCIQTDEIAQDNGNLTYWLVGADIAAKDIYESIVAKEKVAYVPRRWQLIAWLLQITPDWIYDALGGF